MRASSAELTCYKPEITSLKKNKKRDTFENYMVDFPDIESGEALEAVDEYLHRGPRTQHGTLQCGGHMLEILMKLARDKESITKIVETEVRGRAAV